MCSGSEKLKNILFIIHFEFDVKRFSLPITPSVIMCMDPQNLLQQNVQLGIPSKFSKDQRSS